MPHRNGRLVEWPGNFLGLRISGDLGDLTYWQTRNNQLVACPRTSPKEPASPEQRVQRDKFAQAIANWLNLSESERRDWETLAMRNSLCATGLNTWIHLSFRQDPMELLALCDRAGIALDMPPNL